MIKDHQNICTTKLLTTYVHVNLKKPLVNLKEPLVVFQGAHRFHRILVVQHYYFLFHFVFSLPFLYNITFFVCVFPFFSPLPNYLFLSYF